MPLLQKRDLSSYEGQYLVENERERFELFYSLIPYLKELEACVDAREDALTRKAQAKGKLEMPLLTTIVSAVLITLALAIPFLIVFYIVTNVVKLDNGESLFSLYETWMESEPIFNGLMTKLLDSIDPDKTFLSLMVGLIGIVVIIVIPPCVYVLFPVVFVFCIISGIFNRKAARVDLKECDEICEEMDLNIEQLIQILSVPVQMVPSDYQYSEALEYFCNSYINGRANSLQEAIAAYDTYLHRKKMEHAQEVIHDEQTKIMNEIHDQQQQLDRMQDSIRRVKNRVDWL